VRDDGTVRVLDFGLAKAFGPAEAGHYVQEGRRSGFTAGPPTMVFRGDYLAPQAGRRNYDVSADGKRFLMIKKVAATSTPPPPQLIIVQHFDEELRRLAPAQ
jgi:hypothetical protein